MACVVPLVIVLNDTSTGGNRRGGGRGTVTPGGPGVGI